MIYRSGRRRQTEASLRRVIPSLFEPVAIAEAVSWAAPLTGMFFFERWARSRNLPVAPAISVGGDPATQP